MSTVEIICLVMGVIGILLILLPEPKYEDLFEKYFLFCIVICIGIFFSNLVSMYK
jgi:uncharacterized membrane protein